MADIFQNIEFIRKRIKDLSTGVNVSLVAVTKTFGADMVQKAVSAGITDIGESKIQEALPKFEVLSNDGVFKNIKKHFIGHLQSNKAKKAVLNFDLIQSLDSVELASCIDKHAGEAGKVQDCLIELKISPEDTKYGATEEKVNAIYCYCIEKCVNIKICGIMAIAPYFEEKEKTRPYFKKAFNVFNGLKSKLNDRNFTVLSMGMSDDFEIAVQEGANMVRIGSGIFGDREYDK